MTAYELAVLAAFAFAALAAILAFLLVMTRRDNSWLEQARASAILGMAELTKALNERNAKIAKFEADEVKRAEQRKRASLIAAEKRRAKALKKAAKAKPVSAMALSPCAPRGRDAVVPQTRELRTAKN